MAHVERRGALQGRRAIITGAARGIGLACARRFAAEGAGVLVVDRDAEAGAAAVAEIAATGVSTAFHQADLALPESVPAIIAAAERGLGGVDILINNAGIAPTADFFELDAVEFDLVMAINLRAPMLLTQAAARRMRAAGTGGAVVNLSSINAVLGGPTSLSYSVSKGGLNQLTRACAIALAPFAIRVNAVGPGTIETELAAAAGLTGQGVRPVLERTPMGRLGQAEEIAAVAAFLASDQASYVTGQTVYADGGRLGLNYSLTLDSNR
jgi:NAD(P)-dependent dehydrogenase (short-subunit alcohol dehydrogenase family)